MSRPQITPENGPAIYDFQRKHPAKYSKYGQMAMSKIWRPRVIWAHGVEQATEQHLNDGHALLWTTNHEKGKHDQSVIAAAGYREPALSSTIGNFYVGIKPSLQQFWLLRYAVDGMGSITAFRYQDFLNRDGTPNPRLLTYQAGLTEGFISTAVAKSDAGNLGFLFSTGERDKQETGRVDKIKAGIGHIASRINPDLEPAVLVGGFYYPTFRGTGVKNHLRPTMVMAELLTDLPNDPQEITQLIQPAMQNAMDLARELSPSRIYA